MTQSGHPTLRKLKCLPNQVLLKHKLTTFTQLSGLIWQRITGDRGSASELVVQCAACSATAKYTLHLTSERGILPEG